MVAKCACVPCCLSAVGNGMSLDMAPLRCLMGTSYYTQLLMYVQSGGDAS